MPRRIEIELTSRTDDGGFTWRAAGAKQPKGTLSGDLLPGGVGIGDVVRAELESGLDGLEVVTVLPRQERSQDEPVTRIEVLGAPRRPPDVSVTYAPGSRRRRDDAEGPGDGRPGRGERAPRRESARRPGGGRGPGAGPGERGQRPPGERPERAEPRAARGAGSRARGADGVDRAERTDRRGRSDAEHRAATGARRERRPVVSTAHRNALLGTLGPQELPIAEQLLRGGIPAVRQAIAEQNGRRTAGPAASVNADAVLAIAEQLLPKVNLATWKDRATSAQSAGKELRLRELRAVVTASRTVTLDDEARALAKSLRESLDQRVTALREGWLTRIAKGLEDGRVTDALTVASQPPEPATRLPAELAVRLADGAGAAMTSESGSAQWLALLDAVVESPVRRTVKPRGIPPTPETQDAARRAAGSVPELAKLLGLRIPPPPPRRPPTGPRVMAAGGAGAAAGR